MFIEQRLLGGRIDRGGGGRSVGGTTHAHWASGSLFTGCVLLEVTGRKGECAHAWAPQARDSGYLGDGEALSPGSGSASTLYLAWAAEEGVALRGVVVGSGRGGAVRRLETLLLSTYCVPGSVEFPRTSKTGSSAFP